MIRESQRDYMIVLSIAFASFLARLNLYTVNVSLPTISRAFNIGTSEASQIVTAYLVVITGTLILFGKLGDKLGFKDLFIIGYIVFILGSLLCGLSQGIYSLIASRFLQGLGSSILLATSFAMIAQTIPREKLGWAFGINATATAIGVAAGAPLGGIIAGYFSWRLVFLINIPLGVIAIFFALRYLPSSNTPQSNAMTKSGGFDILGAILSFSALSVLLYVINEGSKRGWTSPTVLMFAVASVLLFICFVLWEKQCANPLLDTGMLKSGGFVFALLATTMAYMLIAGNSFLLPFFLELVKGINSAQTGMVLLTYSLIYVFVSPYAGKLSDRTNPVRMCAIAMLSGAVNTFVFAYTMRLSGIVPVIVFLGWLGFSYVFFLSPINSLVMGLAPKGKEGAASGLLNTAINLSMVFGVAVFELIFSQSLSGSAQGGINLNDLRGSQVLLYRGFSYSYVAGGLMCLAAMAFSIMVKQRPRNNKIITL
ncbi:MAG: Riboflavin transporter RibZ [Syntrophorhabdaceae bacterium]|nr:Riboflavin transporter RibZ [Syntrophorhabdaceae bacterium]